MYRRAPAVSQERNGIFKCFFTVNFCDLLRKHDPEFETAAEGLGREAEAMVHPGAGPKREEGLKPVCFRQS